MSQIQGRARRWALLAALPAVMAVLAPTTASARGWGGVIRDIPTGAPVPVQTVTQEAGLLYWGGPVLHSNRTHVVFWQPAGSGLRFGSSYEALIERFLAQVAAASRQASNVYGLSGQYYDSGGPAAYDSTYGGAVVATDALPASQCREPATGPAGWSACVTDAQLQQELERVTASHRLPRLSTDIYFMVLPSGLGNCTDSTSQTCALGGSVSGYCGYHSQAADGLLYAVIPYNAVPGHCQSGNPRPNRSPADPAISTISHEHNETVTDPETYNSWIDPNGDEIGDLCITNYGRALGGARGTRWNEAIAGGHYWLQEEWSNEDNSCQPRDESDRVGFWAAHRAIAGQTLRLKAYAADRDGRIIAYDWSFGDGRVSHKRVVAHTFTRAGRYRVVLRVVDSAENWSYAAWTFRVAPASAARREQKIKPH